MSQGYLYLATLLLFPIGTKTGKTGLLDSSSREPFVNIVVLFHAFTGLQCRFRRYLYLVAFIVFPRNRHLPLRAVFVGLSPEFVDHIIDHPDI